MLLRSFVPVSIAILSAAGLSVLGARIAVDRIEASARAEITRALAEDGHGWTEVRVDGLQVILTGTAPDEAARFGAVAAAGHVIDATRIIDRMTVTPASAIAAPEFKIEVLRNRDGISLIGLVPAALDRSEVLEAVAALSDAPVADLLEEGDYPVPDGWQDAVDLAFAALERLPRSKVSVTAGAVEVTAIADSEESRKRIERELTARAPEGVVLTLDISAPRPVIAPFTVRFVIEGDGPHFDACAAETPEMQAPILAAARAAGAAEGVTCRIGLGAPTLDWGEAVAAGIRAVAGLGAGSVTYSDADVSLVAPHTVEPETFDRAAGRLERALPEGYSLTAVLTPPPEEETTDQGRGDRPFFTAVLAAEGGLEIAGRVRSERMRGTVESYAHGRFGRDATESTLRVADAVPAGWSLRLLAGLDALAYLSEGQVRVGADTLSVSGKTGREEAPADIARILSDRLGSGADFDIDVAYVEELDPEAGLLTPDQCLKRLNGILADQKITFEPGSATVDGDGLKIIDRLAEILPDCGHVPMEIAGHTDSQGRESMNLRLSQDRANAVLNAIMARRVLTSNLSAKGYGEAVPIADNATEQGREDNRRIEFTLLPPPPEAGAEDGEGTAAEPGEGAENEQN